MIMLVTNAASDRVKSLGSRSDLRNVIFKPENVIDILFDIYLWKTYRFSLIINV